MLADVPDSLAGLDHAARIDALVELQRRRAVLDAAEQRLLAQIAADPSPDPSVRSVVLAKHYVREEVACALRVAHETARSKLEIASSLARRLPSTLSALERGEVTYVMARTLVEAVATLDDQVATKVEGRVLTRAGSQSTGEFRRAVRRAVAILDPSSVEERHEQGLAERRVAVTDEDNGMASLYAYLPAPEAQAIWVRLNDTIHTATATATATASTPAGDDRTMDQRRADTLVDLILGTCDSADLAGRTGTGARSGARAGGTGGTGSGLRPLVQVTVALSTLLGLDQQPGDLTGHGPIPATLARRIAHDPTGTWRRLLTDPPGQLIDYGTTRYRPPPPLARHVTTRDQLCRLPGCHRAAARAEIDHIRPYADGGPTDAANLHALCPRHHHLKHEAGWTVHRDEDGTTVWTTPTGHQYLKPPAALPTDHTTDQPDDGAA